MDWLTDVTGQIASATGLDADALTPDDRDAEMLLDLAAIAAHASGARTNAPLLCHVLGRAAALGASLDECARVVRAHAGEG
jgi:hypothetical protein